MSAVLAANLSGEFPNQLEDDVFDEEPEDAIEMPEWEPRRVHVPRFLVWGVLSLFVVAILAMSMWGLAHSTWWYGMTQVDAATTARLAQMHRELLAAGVPESSVRRLATAAQPETYVDEAIEALLSADQDLEKLGSNPTVASARAELQVILANLSHNRFGRGGDLPTYTPLPTFTFLTPQP